jgi:hypothetical protein
MIWQGNNAELLTEKKNTAGAHMQFAAIPSSIDIPESKRSSLEADTITLNRFEAIQSDMDHTMAWQRNPAENKRLS